jgi:hypothetical protein
MHTHMRARALSVVHLTYTHASPFVISKDISVETNESFRASHREFCFNSFVFARTSTPSAKRQIRIIRLGRDYVAHFATGCAYLCFRCAGKKNGGHLVNFLPSASNCVAISSNSIVHSRFFSFSGRMMTKRTFNRDRFPYHVQA